MPAHDFLVAVILGIVEGATEFLPVSSTGHLIIAKDLMGLAGDRIDTFVIFIQLGAILAVAWERRTALTNRAVPLSRLALLIALAFAPTAIVGLAAYSAIKSFFASSIVAWTLIVGAVAILLIERYHPEPRRDGLAEMSGADAVKVGLAQCVAMIPGVSRAGATILGGMAFGLSRPLATEFSFLLAIPTIAAAVTLDLYKSWDHLSWGDAPFFLVGLVSSFAFALLVVRWLLGYVRSHDFRPFAAWRLTVGGLILWLQHSGIVSFPEGADRPQ